MVGEQRPPRLELRHVLHEDHGGLGVLRRAGFADNTAMVASLFAERAPIMAQPGDLAAIQTETGDALGVVQGEAIYVLGPAGLSLVPITAAHRAFRV